MREPAIVEAIFARGLLEPREVHILRLHLEEKQSIARIAPGLGVTTNRCRELTRIALGKLDVLILAVERGLLSL